MRRCNRIFAALAILALSLTVALAQEPNVMQRYDSALASLEQSVSLLPADIPGSLDALETASTALRRLSQDTSSSVLTDAMSQVFERARTAIVNQSQTDLQVQTAVLRGGFQRGLLEASLADSESGATPGLVHLATSLEMPDETVSTIAAATDASTALAAYQSGLATRVSALISDSALQLPASQATAYISLATAYGDFLSLQDSPRADSGLNERFTSLIDAVVEADQARVAAEAPELSAQFTALAAGLAGPERDAVPAPLPPVEEPAAATEAAVPAEPVLIQQAEVTPTEEPATAEPAEAADPENAAPVAETPAEPEATAPEPVIDLAAIRAQLEAETSARRQDAIVAELGQSGIRGAQAESIAAGLLRSGHDSLASVLVALNAGAVTFTDLVASGNQTAASRQLATVSGLYRSSVAQVASRAAPEAAAALDRLFNRLAASPVLQNADALALNSQLQTVTRSTSRLQAASTPANAQAPLQTRLTGLTSGWPRLLLTVLAGLLSILPLVLLRMAFGGGNRNWALIGTGLFLLLLPVMLSALAEVLGLLAGLLDLEVAGLIGGWLNPGSQLMQLVNLLLVLLAIILSSAGLYGICRQFGLFGGAEGRSGLFGKRSADRQESKTLVDWDEEF